MYSFSSFQTVSLNFTTYPILITFEVLGKAVHFHNAHKVCREPLLVLRGCICILESLISLVLPSSAKQNVQASSLLPVFSFSRKLGSSSIKKTIPYTNTSYFSVLWMHSVGSHPYSTWVLTEAIHTKTSIQQWFGEQVFISI